MGRSAALSLALLTGACRQILGIDDPLGPDAVQPPDAPPCTWSPPVTIPINSSMTDDDPALSRDGQLLAFVSTRNGNYDLFVALADSAGNFQNVTSLPINSPTTDFAPAWNANATRLYFSSDRTGNGKTGLFVSEFDGGSFGTPVQLDLGISLFGPTLSTDELELFYTTSSSAIGHAIRGNLLEPFQDLGIVAELGGAGSLDINPSLSGDGLTLYWQHGVNGDPTHIVRARRAARDAPFGAREPIAELASLETDGSPDISPDERRIVFSSQRSGGIGLSDLYQSKLVCP